MRSEIPDDDLRFDALIREIDQELAASGSSIPGRPIAAVIAMGRRFGLSMPIAKPPHGMDHQIAQHWPITEKIYRWYDELYGERIKMDFSPGRMVILIEGDPWVMRLPRIWGSVMFAALRTTGSDQPSFSRDPSLCNVVELIESMPPARIKTLSDAALEHIYDRFVLGLNAFGILQGSSSHELVRIAHGNIAAAVSHLMAQGAQYAESKWASLQAAEKVMKAAINLAGTRYAATHDLNRLMEQAQQAGIRANLTPLIAAIQCAPGIRYGEEPCTRDDAIAAHHASLELIIALYEAGAAFQTNIAG